MLSPFTLTILSLPPFLLLYHYDFRFLFMRVWKSYQPTRDLEADKSDASILPYFLRNSCWL